MGKLGMKTFVLAVVFAGSAYAGKGQQYVKDLLTHKVIVNQLDYTIVAYVKPVKRISLDTDKHYYWFSPDQVNSTQGGFSGKLLNGSYQESYANKQLKVWGYLNKGLKSGLWKSWDGKGRLQEDYTWSSGQLNGIYHKYDSVGKISETGKYKNDLLHGKHLKYIDTEVTELVYKKGKVITRKRMRMPKFFRNVFHKKPKSM